jgi:hypothetical protein
MKETPTGAFFQQCLILYFRDMMNSRNHPAAQSPAAWLMDC